eukprot:CAMPEP_0171901750 /NCGR_PEP_ID=MMETSP0993-20121228/660_1 /TAXON_ID=483369 /ORGANISM="non described non described, Strain CCMP2098" /LENGTH=40 /DNA_ID= /DNA_START= /DNA_END= /DNA_ORIENTATION=
MIMAPLNSPMMRNSGAEACYAIIYNDARLYNDARRGSTMM